MYVLVGHAGVRAESVTKLLRSPGLLCCAGREKKALSEHICELY